MIIMTGLQNMFIFLSPILQLSNLTEHMPFRGLDTCEVEVRLYMESYIITHVLNLEQNCGEDCF